jgi:integrase
LRFGDIQDGYINFRQEKTKNVERLKLTNFAREIIEKQRACAKGRDKIFDLLYHTTSLEHIKKWLENAGIKKHITWHCGRHTFATLALTYDVDLSS